MHATYDAVIVGGGHNGLTAAAYLARAGRTVLLLERADHVGGATLSARAFPGVDANVSRYSYLVSLMPRQVRDELGLRVELRRRRISSYTPAGDRGLLVDTADDAATAASFADVGAGGDVAAWRAFGARTGALAARLFPTMTEPLLSTADARRLLGDGRLARPGRAAGRRGGRRDVRLRPGPRGRAHRRAHRHVRPRARAGRPANRCFLYHVIGGGTGDWDVPVGGMGAVAGALEAAARAAGAELRDLRRGHRDRPRDARRRRPRSPGPTPTAASTGWARGTCWPRARRRSWTGCSGGRRPSSPRGRSSS